MTLILRTALALLGLSAVVQGATEYLDSLTPKTCQGIWGPVLGTSSPGLISVRLLDSPSIDSLQVLVYKYQDYALIDHSDDEEFAICTMKRIFAGKCTDSDFGQVGVNRNVTSQAPIHSVVLGSKSGNLSTEYKVESTGRYCVYVRGVQDSQSQMAYMANVQYKNSYGYLPSAFYPTLPFYALSTLVYLAVGILWTAGCFYWKDILTIQYFVSGVLFFLVVESGVNYWLYSNFNATGSLSIPILFFVVVFNAGRNSLSWFMLLIVALGYGVLRPTLGKALKLCIGVAVAHFITGVIYSAGSLLITDMEGVAAILITFPLSIMITVFYYWTLHALSQTIQTLKEKKQNVKLEMYKKVTFILGISVILVALGLIVSSVSVSNVIYKNEYLN